MAFTELYCRTDGSNLNAGSVDSATAAFTYASGSWVASTGVFTVASGNPQTDGVVVGDFASVYPNGSTLAVFIGRVTAVSSTTITVSLTAKSGTAPTNGTNSRTLKIGGAWAGPSAAIDFPFDFVQNTQTNSAGDRPRVNIKNGTYTITAVIAAGTVQNGIVFQGFTTTPGDGGKPTIDGNVGGVPSIVLITVSGVDITLRDFIFKGGGITGSSTGVSITGVRNLLHRIVVWNCRGTGIDITGGNATILECESYSNNVSNGTLAGFSSSIQCAFIRCISHDNTGSSNSGFRITATTQITFRECIIDSNGLHGISISSANIVCNVLNCDIYNNGANGINVGATSTATLIIENTNFIKNVGYGVERTNGRLSGLITNCGFGSGTMANGSGKLNSTQELVELNTVDYAADITPWNDPDNGDFDISLNAAKDTGRGSFTQTQAGYSGTVGYNDIGAAKHVTPPESGGPLIGKNILIG